MYIYIYIYIYMYVCIYIHPFSKRFSYREIYRYIDTFVFLHVRPCAFFTRYCPTWEKTRFNDKFFCVGFFVPIWKEHIAEFFSEKCTRPAIKFAMANYMADYKPSHTFGKNGSPQIGRPLMSWHLYQVAKHFLLMKCIMRCPRAFLRETEN